MDQTVAERLLCAWYALAAACGAVQTVTAGVAWSHWRLTLDRCVGRNCSCPLYGESTPTHFLGGGIPVCAWVTAGPAPVVLVFCVLAAYHGVRSCFGARAEVTRSVFTKNESGEVLHVQVRAPDTRPLPRAFWTALAALTAAAAAYQLALLATFADGYLHTCRQYRRELVKLLRLSGSAVDVVHSRIPCNAVLDFMDYLQPDTGRGLRGGVINTAAALLSGLVCSAVACACLALAALLNARQARAQPA